MPILDVDNAPEGEPVAPGNAGTLSFYRQGQAKTTGFQATADGALSAPAGLTATYGATALRIPQGEFTPQDHGFESWTHDLYYPASSVIAVNGRVYVVKLMLRRAVTLASVWWSVATAGATPTAGQNQIGIYDPDGDLLNSAVVDDDISSSGGKETTLAAPLTSTYVWAGFLFNASTAPTLVRGSSFESAPNLNTTAATRRAAVVASGATTLPASFDPATLSTSNCLTFFAALEAA